MGVGDDGVESAVVWDESEYEREDGMGTCGVVGKLDDGEAMPGAGDVGDTLSGAGGAKGEVTEGWVRMGSGWKRKWRRRGADGLMW